MQFLLLGRGFSMLSHILALPWIFNFNGRFWRITYPVLRYFSSVGVHAMEPRGRFGPAVSGVQLWATFGRTLSANTVFLVLLVGS